MSASSTIQEADRKASAWLSWHEDKLTILARAGYAARGLVYLVVGGLAFAAAVGHRANSTGSRGALLALMDAPGGMILMILLIIGLVGYSAWRFIQSLRDTDQQGTELKGLVIRAGLFVSGVTHLLLALFALSLVAGWGKSSGGTSWTEKLLGMPLGQVLLGIIGAVVIGAGIAHLVKGVKAGYRKYMKIQPSTAVDFICRFGLIAKGVTFGISGMLLISAAWWRKSQETGGMKDALQTLQEQPYGPWLLGTVALGLIAFGVYSFVEARHRRIDVK